MSFVKKEVQYTDIDKYRCLEFLRKNSVELYLSYCGKENCAPGHTYGPAVREEYLLHYILEGEGTFSAGGKSWNLTKNDAFLIFPDETTIYSSDVQNPWSYIWVAFDGLKAFASLEQAGFSKTERVGHFTREKDLLRCVDTILDSHQPTYSNDMIRQSQLIIFLACMIQEYQEHTDKPEAAEHYPQKVYVDYAVQYIEQNYHREITVNDICHHVGITRGYLTKIFQQTFHTSPYEYLLQVRMNQAVFLLKSTSLPVSQIAGMVGYRDAPVFSKLFKQRTGLSPKAYRISSNTLVFSDHKEGN